MSRYDSTPRHRTLGKVCAKLALWAWHAACITSLAGCFYVGNPWVPDDILEPYLLSYSPKTNVVIPGSVGTLSAKIASPATEWVLVEWYINNEETTPIAQEINI